ncbi:hypothetical protein LOK49_LG05G03904 [Camellia lanceoleosa]|uniref:Uncharacterized protein n=1 Tax=Camellia lanceoleosa TaxID=1840588 RepID=A0ACC0HT45_9ERIC|nr:hypothetical protein LOK49_LG05G03904 [Camellia lanceoleosa]
MLVLALPKERGSGWKQSGHGPSVVVYIIMIQNFIAIHLKKKCSRLGEIDLKKAAHKVHGLFWVQLELCIFTKQFPKILFHTLFLKGKKRHYCKLINHSHIDYFHVSSLNSRFAVDLMSPSGLLET